MTVSFVDIGEIVDHQCFKIYFHRLFTYFYCTS